MSTISAKETSGKKTRRDIAGEIANTFEWLIVAFVLAFLFRAFVMEAFRIPTGSMADTLKGAHFRLRCSQCGYRYDRGADSGNSRPVNNGLYTRLPHAHCPSCGYEPPAIKAEAVSGGDRILVLKCIYQFVEPKRWDVIVFKNPLDPRINYIKRLIGRPGEVVEIIDGDIYINGKIRRKPAKVQKQLWMPVYDNDYQPVRPQEPFFNGHRWRQPLKNSAGSKWRVSKDRPTEFQLHSPSGVLHTLVYDTSVGNNFRACYAYNDVTESAYRPVCSDLMVRFYACSDNVRGQLGASVSKYGRRYAGYVDFDGELIISGTTDGREQVLARKQIELPPAEKPAAFSFANVDHQLILRFGGEKLVYDLGSGPDDAGERQTRIEPEVKIFGSGELRISHIGIFRDIHYLSRRLSGGGRGGRATEGRAFVLGDDEFFVLGDNSPNSQDSRWWDRDGIGNDGRFYRRGIVPRDYLVGKAMFVYWPSGYEFPWPAGFKSFLAKNSRRNGLLWVANKLVRLKWIPDISGMRFIYGGSNKGPAD